MIRWKMISFSQIGLVLLFSASFAWCRSLKCPGGKQCSNRPPVVLIPGDLGNQLEAKLDKPSVVHYICYKKTDQYFTLWLNLDLLLPVAIDCWIDNMRLIYNRTTRSTEAPPGVDIRVPGFGQTFGLEYLDPSKRSVDENKEYFLKLQLMIEEMAQRSGSPVVLVAHSMGNMYTLYFLNQQPQAWKDKYIKAFVCLGPPWAGVAKTLRVMASGDNNRIPVISSLKIRTQQRTAVTTAWLFPYAHTWPSDKSLVSTPSANYTVKDYERFFKDISYEDGWAMRQDTEPLVQALEAPGVPVHCLYGTGIPTAEAYRYKTFPDSEPEVVNGEGDGTVNMLSAVQCKRWIDQQKHPVRLVELPGNEHVAMLLNYTTVAYIKNVLFSP
ncbi:Group XV phospholipase A2 [Bagarius yarrelli]|uniref:Group XV phospholipase A2 n=1 Tax=Bagarius yarrelli TaxID=175774 RepID=A0A556V101_BAGYA|nr:Group XV phospholipase A2 [Bagarius yarrelli]